MNSENLKRILSLDYQFAGSIKQEDENSYVIKLFNGKEKGVADNLDDAIRFVRLKTMALQEIAPVPYAIDILRLGKRKTYMLFPSVKDIPAVELPSYHFIKINSVLTNASSTRLARHINPENVSFNDISRVLLYDKKNKLIFNRVISIITAILLLVMLVAYALLSNLSNSMSTISALTDVPAFTVPTIVSMSVLVLFGIGLVFLIISPQYLFRKKLFDKTNNLAFENKSWWKEYRYKVLATMASVLFVAGFVVSTFFVDYFFSKTAFFNDYFTRNLPVTFMFVITILSNIFTGISFSIICYSWFSMSYKEKQYLETYIPKKDRPLFNAWKKSTQMKDISYKFDYESYRFKPKEETFKLINEVVKAKSKYSKEQAREIKAWTRDAYHSSLKTYLAKKTKINNQKGL